ncbi:3-hydroxyacyl-CoA dehydrogenase family protein [Streptomyces sp. NPDC048516]|uniref:3-hydroxyacyl-CoA dehydrogenase family protein n=1 Tax=Streptomyces sp. NPDC048516 TaxID=3365565 RepID=UPI0037171740
MARPASALGVIGLGSLGESILLALATTGRDVIGVDPDLNALSRVAGRLKAAGLDSVGVTLTDDTSELAHTAVIVEAVPEDLSLKASVLREAHSLCADHTVLVTTTAALSVTGLAVASGRPDRTLGLRIPVPIAAGGAVEPVRTAMSSDEPIARLHALLDAAGLRRSAVGCRPGADADALVRGFMNRAAALYESGYADAEDIDSAMRLGCGLPTGPLELLDRIGIETVHFALTEEWRRTGRASLEPAPVLADLIAAGHLGRKSGRGFHTYDDSGDRVAAEGQPGSGGVARNVQRIGVLGSGTMARGIAEATVVAGFPTVLMARDGAKASRAVSAVEESLAGKLKRGRMSPDAKTAAVGRLLAGEDLSEFADCDLVIEAVVEDLDVKRDLFARLGAVCGPGVVLATTTSSLSVTACAHASGRDADVVGMHFFNPAPVMRLVELCRTEATSDGAAATARAVCAALGKTVVECHDRPGFIVNHLLFPYLNDAVRLLDRSGTDIEETDAAMECGYGYPMGPFTLLDTIGLDVSLLIARRLHDAFGQPDSAPPRLLEQLVADGALGRKNGQGFRGSLWNVRSGAAGTQAR